MKNTTVTDTKLEDPDLQNISFAWPKLSENVKKAVCTLVAIGYADSERRSISEPMTEGANHDNPQ